jgi:hypothetical protein
MRCTTEIWLGLVGFFSWAIVALIVHPVFLFVALPCLLFSQYYSVAQKCSNCKIIKRPVRWLFQSRQTESVKFCCESCCYGQSTEINIADMESGNGDGHAK